MLQMVMDDTVAEALESDNLTLQTMSGGKYVQVPAHLVLLCHRRGCSTAGRHLRTRAIRHLCVTRRGGCLLCIP